MIIIEIHLELFIFTHYLEFVCKMIRKQIANIITAGRIICSILLLFFTVFSLGFYVVYILCGFSDMIDGIVARKTNSTSNFGARLDTVADFIFIVFAGYKLLPTIHISRWMWVWIIIIAVVKMGNIIGGLLRRKTLISIHSILNKATGFVLFIFPLTLQVVELKYSLTVICVIATFAAI